MRKPHFVLSNEATSDLVSLAEYLELVSDIDLADKILTRFYHLFILLADWPGIGRIHKEIVGSPYSFTIRPWIVFYEQAVNAEGVHILRVLDGRRDLATLLPKQRKR